MILSRIHDKCVATREDGLWSGAVRLANAIMLEKKLAAMGTRSLRQASEQLGVSEGIILRVLRMLSLTPGEMLRVINETY